MSEYNFWNKKIVKQELCITLGWNFVWSSKLLSYKQHWCDWTNCVDSYGKFTKFWNLPTSISE